jgi:hypothetical protein
MELTAGEARQKRLMRLARGVKAAAFAIDEKFSGDYGRPELTTAGKFSRFSPYRTAMVTLTYRADGMWQEGHLSELIDHYRKWFKRNGKGCAFHYVWVMELTEIGRPHYHMVIWLPKGVRPPLPDQQGWWPHGMTQAVYARSPVGYITKYASKQETKSGRHLPKGARLWGYGGLRMDERAGVAFSMCPRWLKGLIKDDSYPVRRKLRIERFITTAAGSLMDMSRSVVAWTLQRGEAAGWWFFSPYEFAGCTGNGIALRHRGHIEVLTPDGDEFFLSHKG